MSLTITVPDGSFNAYVAKLGAAIQDGACTACKHSLQFFNANLE